MALVELQLQVGDLEVEVGAELLELLVHFGSHLNEPDLLSAVQI